MPRNRSVRVATFSSPKQRPVSASPSLPSRSASALRRRVVVAVLVIASLVLLTVYFRESSGGTLHNAQSIGASVLHPFQVAAERVARPFRDAAGWLGGLIDAKSENEELRQEIDRLRQEAIQSQTALEENRRLREFLRYVGSPRFPHDYRAIAVQVISRPPSQFEQRIVLSAGSNAGIRVHDPVVTADGLVGKVTKVARRLAVVTLLTDETSAVSALDLKTAATGIARHGQSKGSTLILDRVTKDQVVRPGDVIITAGWRSGRLSSLYPKGIPIGRVTGVGQLDTDIYKQIEVQPFVDFSSLESLIVLVPAER